MPRSTPWSLPARDLLPRALEEPANFQQFSLTQWDRLLRQARAASMLGTLGELVEANGGLARVPKPVRGHLWGARIAAERKAEAIRWELRCLQPEIARARVKPVLLKGAAYIAAGVPNAAGRLCNDVDILVPRAHIDRVETVLRWKGWVTTHLAEYDQRYYREWMHELPPMQHMRRGSTLDVHHNILPETVRTPPDPQRLLAQARPLDDGCVFRVLAPHHMVIHSAVHLFSDSEWDTAIRDLYDLHCLLEHFARDDGQAFWDAVVDEAGALQVSGYVHHALRYAQALLGTPVPTGARRALAATAPGAVRQAALDWMFLHAATARSTSHGPVRHAVSRAAVLARSHWIKMPPALLVRHLFYKAFLAPREEGSQDEGAGAARRHG